MPTLADLISRISFLSAMPAVVGILLTGTVLVVSHSGCLRVLLCILLGRDMEGWWRIPLELASLTVVEKVGQEPEIALLNDTSHLGKEEVR